jgi:integrase
MTTLITKKSVAALEPGQKISDSKIAGFIARCLPSGKVQFGYRYGSREARRWITIGLLGEMTPDAARRRAEELVGEVRRGNDPATEIRMETARAENTVDHVLDGYIKAHVSKLRSGKAVAAALDNHVRKAIGKEVIYDLKRSRLVKLRDKIAEDCPAQADRVMSYLRTALTWQQDRDDDFNPPIVRGAYDAKPRERTLTPEEIFDVWRALDELEHVSPAWPAVVRTLLLTACRFSEVAGMHTRELETGNAYAMMGGVGTAKATSWTIPGSRTKNGLAHQVPLIAAIKKWLPERKDGFVFSCDGGKTAISRNYQPKRDLDHAIARIRRREKRPDMKAWVLHDLRRTARTIMAGEGVSEEIAERVLNHKKKGIVAVYNRHEYFADKADALTRLAAHVDAIINSRGRPPLKAAPAARVRVVARG